MDLHIGKAVSYTHLAGAGRRRSPEETAGERIHTAYGIAGARGEAALGFPSALTIGLPALKAWLSQGFSLNDAAVLTLLSLLSQVDDTNMIHRGGLTEAAAGKKEAGALLAELTPGSFREKTAALDQSFICLLYTSSVCRRWKRN